MQKLIKMYAKRLRGIELSRIRKMFDIQGKDIINLGIGEPDFNIPENAKDAIVDALRGIHTLHAK